MHNPSPEEHEAIRHLVNNQPKDDFLGLSSNEMQRLIYNTFEPHSPLRINPKISDLTLDQLPFFRLTEGFLRLIARDDNIKLTRLGALPSKVITELYDYRFIREEAVETGLHKLRREDDSPAMTMLHYNTVYAGLIRKLKGKLVLTKAGERLLALNDRQRLFEATLQSYTGKLAWSCLDGYPSIPVGQLGWGFTILMLVRTGSTLRTAGHYASFYFKAFPGFFQAFPKREFSTPECDLIRCYSLRMFERFLEWWGFVRPEEVKFFTNREHTRFTATNSLKEIFHFDD